METSSTHVDPRVAASPSSCVKMAPRCGVLAREDDPVEHPGDDRSIYFRDPAGNLVEAWDGARHGVRALA